jgi:iron complex transport system substrate-binding protein
MLFALGAGDRVVGVTTYCRYPEEAQQKPKIGGFTSPNVELVLGQKPDLVVVLEDRTDLATKLTPFSIPTLAVKHKDLTGIYESIETLAARLGAAERGRELVSEIRKTLAEITRSIAGTPRKQVLFLVGRNPGTLTDIHAVGKGSYLGQLIELAGGANVFADAPAIYPKVSLEEILARNPEVIIDMSHRQTLRPEQIETVQALWARFPNIRAVRERQVHVVSEDVFVVPGPRVTMAVRSLATMIHGDRAR